MPSNSVGSFFDKNAAGYHGRRAGMQFHHRVIAKQIEDGLTGHVLSVGGLWNDRGDLRHLGSLTVVDLSTEMLGAYNEEPIHALQANATALPFADASFDHVVLPLILHHIAGSTAAQAQHGVHSALRESRRVLRPGGTLWISEFCVAETLYAAELLAVPATRQVLARIETPLVVMHSEEFYRAALRERGFAKLEATRIHAPGAKPYDLITPVIGVPRLKIPRLLYPIHPTLFRATAV